MGGHGIKALAVYGSAWWRQEGLAGLGLGLSPFLITVDTTRPDDEHARLTGLVSVTREVGATYGWQLADAASVRELFLATAADYFGPRAMDAREVHVSDWCGDAWSAGCGSALPPGALTSAAMALRPPVGAIGWAGAETGMPLVDWMDGAISAGERAAREVLQRERIQA